MSHRHDRDDCCEKKCFVKRCCWEPCDPCCDRKDFCGSTFGGGTGFGSGLGVIIFIIIILCLCKDKW